ncbi:YqaE/Pmp3 family membrane protein [Shewanella benthica]
MMLLREIFSWILFFIPGLLHALWVVTK